MTTDQPIIICLTRRDAQLLRRSLRIHVRRARSFCSCTELSGDITVCWEIGRSNKGPSSNSPVPSLPRDHRRRPVEVTAETAQKNRTKGRKIRSAREYGSLIVRGVLVLSGRLDEPEFRDGEHVDRSWPFPFDRNWPTCRSMGTGSRAGNVKPCPRCRDKRVMPSKGPAPPPGNRGSAVRLLMIPVTSRRAEFRLVQTGVSVNCLAELHSEPSSGGGRRGL